MSHAKRLTLFTVVLSLLMFGAVAFGASGVVSDPADNPDGRVDIKRASHGRDGSKIKHTVVAYKRFNTSRGPCVYMDTKGTPAADFAACGLAGMINLNQQRTSGNLSIKRPDRKTIVYKFRPRAIKKPGSYDWYVEEPGEECGCDRAPNHGRVTHNL